MEKTSEENLLRQYYHEMYEYHPDLPLFDDLSPEEKIGIVDTLGFARYRLSKAIDQVFINATIEIKRATAWLKEHTTFHKN